MRRRHLLALPLPLVALALASPALASPAFASPALGSPAFAHDWRRNVAELRLGTAGSARPLGIPVRLHRTNLVTALHRGQLEAARLDPASLARASRLMGPRLAIHGSVGVLASLPTAMQADLAAALA